MRDSYILYTDKLKGEYLEVFDKIQLYVNSFDIDEDTREDQLGNLLDTFLSAQDENRSVYDITGKDIAAFCKSFCEDYSLQNRLVFMFDQLQSYAKLVFFISLLILCEFFFQILDGKEVHFWTFTGDFNLSGYIFALMICGVLSSGINLITRNIISRNKSIPQKALNWTVVAFFLITAICVFLLMDWDATNILKVPCWVLLLISGTYLILYHALNRRRLAARNKVKLLDSQEMKDSFTQSFEKEMEKKMKKKNAKRLKKGMGELTVPELLDEEEKECAKMDKLKYIYILLPLAIISSMCIFTEFESLTDMIIMVTILFIVEYYIMFVFWKLTITGLKERRAWIAGKREEIQE